MVGGLIKRKNTTVNETKKSAQTSEHEVTVVLNEDSAHENKPIQYAREERDIPIGRIRPDEENARTRYLLPDNPTKNVLPEDHPDYAENQRLIDGLIEFAEQLKVEALQTPIAVFNDKGRFKVIFGNRRYFAMKIAFGEKAIIPCIVYDSRPSNKSALRFIENFQREELSFCAKVIDFKSALADVSNNSLVSKDKLWLGLGISRTLFYSLKFIVDTPAYFRLVEKGLLQKHSDVDNKVKPVIKTDEEMESLTLLLEKGEKLDDALKQIVSGRDAAKKLKRGRVRKFISFPRLPKKQAASVIKDIIGGKLADLDWSNLDWEDPDAVEARLKDNIELLSRGIR